MSDGFVKIYGSKLLKSTLWLESVEARLLFIGMLAEADADGVVDIPSVKALAHRMNMTVEQTESGLAVLESPDPESRTDAMEGRRVVRDGRVWRVVNYDKYREMRTERQEAERLRKARERADPGRVPDNADARGRVPDSADMSERWRKNADMSASRPHGRGHVRKNADANADEPDTALEAEAEREAERENSPLPPKGGGSAHAPGSADAQAPSGGGVLPPWTAERAAVVFAKMFDERWGTVPSMGGRNIAGFHETVAQTAAKRNLEPEILIRETIAAWFRLPDWGDPRQGKIMRQAPYACFVQSWGALTMAAQPGAAQRKAAGPSIAEQFAAKGWVLP